MINQALEEIKRTGLLREEETEILKFQIQERQYHRGYAVKLMQLQNAIEYEKVRTGGEQEVALQSMLHQLEMAEHEDAYKDDRFYKEIEKSQPANEPNYNCKRSSTSSKRTSGVCI